ncbi:MAG: hypothetical protein COA78_26795 [Blastopirellula sp.]|nr:MAG: hypothetical protein COA78_26795 [Blastopirellula sp.]
MFENAATLAVIGCAVDPSIRGYVTVLKNDYFARSNQQGSFKLSRPLKPGLYTITAVHPQHGKVSKEFEITSGNNKTSIDLVFIKEKNQSH